MEKEINKRPRIVFFSTTIYFILKEEGSSVKLHNEQSNLASNSLFTRFELKTSHLQVRNIIRP